MLLKTNGIEVMVSAFQSIETSFGIEISDATMKLINERRTEKVDLTKYHPKMFTKKQRNLPSRSLHLFVFLNFGD